MFLVPDHQSPLGMVENPRHPGVLNRGIVQLLRRGGVRQPLSEMFDGGLVNAFQTSGHLFRVWKVLPGPLGH
ncbi:hypothetical protein [Nocardiopsis sp. M1B1]|uniref:hypothetical protein n=1 Tax=Nocardiopsis sp. M1B1 TaxID=3450454 RepID=UPI004039C86B